MDIWAAVTASTNPSSLPRFSDVADAPGLPPVGLFTRQSFLFRPPGINSDRFLTEQARLGLSSGKLIISLCFVANFIYLFYQTCQARFEGYS